MNTRLSQEKLEEMVVGVQPNPNAIFFEHAVLNVEKSKAADRRLYDKKIFIKLSQHGVRDSMSYEAQKADIEEYPEEYQYFLQNRQGSRQVGIEIIPNLNIAHLQELRDCGILTIPKFAEMEIVPPHLEYAHAAAKVLNQALKEMTNANEENSIEESKITSPEKVQAMLETDRPEYEHNIGRRELPESDKNNEGSGDPERDEEDRQLQHDPFISPNWSMSF